MRGHTVRQASGVRKVYDTTLRHGDNLDTVVLKVGKVSQRTIAGCSSILLFAGADHIEVRGISKTMVWCTRCFSQLSLTWN